MGPYGFPLARRTEGNAIAALVLSIVSFVVCPLIPAIVALFLASTAKRNIDASGGMLDGASMVTAARVISWINIGLCVAFVLLMVVLAAAGGFDDEYGRGVLLGLI